jgi:hypothetical protein
MLVDELVREDARRMLAVAVRARVDAYLAGGHPPRVTERPGSAAA